MSRFAAMATAAAGQSTTAKPAATKAIFSPLRWRKPYAQVDRLLGERNSLRSIVRATGLARNTIAKRVKKSVATAAFVAPPTPETGAEKAVGGPRTGGDVALCGPQTAQGVAVASRRTRQPAHRGLGAGSRGTASLQRLWTALPRRYHRHTRYLTNRWRVYPLVLPAPAHVVGKTGTRVVEALNSKLRHRCGVLVRRSRSFSKCRASHYNRIKIAIDQHNSEITLY